MIESFIRKCDRYCTIGTLTYLAGSKLIIFFTIIMENMEVMNTFFIRLHTYCSFDYYNNYLRILRL